MCGRFVLYSEPEVIQTVFRLGATPDLVPRFNIAPTQTIPVIRESRMHRSLVPLRWGLIASWAADPAAGPHPINARSKTVHLKPSFKDAYRCRRCIIPADGFYEWKAVGRRKQPLLIQVDGGRLFAMAGIWERWTPPDPSGGEPIESCTILTTDANDALRPIHDRMPVILDMSDIDRWLAPSDEPPADLLRPLPSERIGSYPVGQLVNAVRNDSPQCLEPAEPLNEDEPDGPTLFSGLA